MADLKLVPVRATISVGGITVKTPYVVSFNVNRARGQISSFSATLKVPYSSLDDAVGGEVTIDAGPAGSENRIFTGICRNSNVTPCRDDPSYVLLTISGNDILSELQGKKITRRCKSSLSTWVSINNIVRPGLKSGKLAYVPSLEHNWHEEPLVTIKESSHIATVGQHVPDDKEVASPPGRGQDRNPNLTVIPFSDEGGA
jgi:hypothetical protein